MLNLAKLELAKLGHRMSEDGQEHEEDPIPQQVKDTDRINLGTVVQTCGDTKLVQKLLKSHETNTGIKVRRINKNQS